MLSFTMTVLPLSGVMTLLWFYSLAKKDAGIVDRFWGLLFVILSLLYVAGSDSSSWRQYLVMGLVCIWGGRLSLHIYLRNRNLGEDPRYARMRRYHGKSFWWYSFFSVFLLQGVLAAIVSLPLWFLLRSPGAPSVLLTDIVGLMVWCTGFVFEAGGDWQLMRFKSRPGNRGQLLTSGLWSLCRHPNYFGDACIWWGFWILAVGVDYGWTALPGPLLMTWLLRWVSGVSLLEKSLKKAKPDYQDYMKETPAFIPKFRSKRKV